MAVVMRQSPTVRISQEAHQALRDLSAQTGEPMQTVLERAIENYRRETFLDRCDAAYAALRQDPDAWAEYQKDVSAWDGALMDGLDPEEVWTEGDGVPERREDG